jgi:ubiquinone/menaquinone biosynthesis C-methylase UbiE
MTTDSQLFDSWPDRYNSWFTTPIGKLVLETEQELVLRYVNPSAGDVMLDAGCGTAVFTTDFLAAGAAVTGLDISREMLRSAVKKTGGKLFNAVQADMTALPFADNSFGKTVSITALEFVDDAQTAVDELFRVTKPGGLVVLATLNSLSPWAERRKQKTLEGQNHILENAFYRSPSDLLSFATCKGEYETVVHFLKTDDHQEAVEKEKEGKQQKLDTGAFVAVRWRKP